jgi:hypothetical protein
LIASFTCGTSGASRAMPSMSPSLASSRAKSATVLHGQAMRDLGDVLVPEVARGLGDDAVDLVEEAPPRGGQDEAEAIAGRRAGTPACRRRGAQRLHRGADAVDRGRVHARPVVQHAVHGGRADARAFRDLLDGGCHGLPGAGNKSIGTPPPSANVPQESGRLRLAGRQRRWSSIHLGFTLIDVFDDVNTINHIRPPAPAQG